MAVLGNQSVILCVGGGISLIWIFKIGFKKRARRAFNNIYNKKKSGEKEMKHNEENIAFWGILAVVWPVAAVWRNLILILWSTYFWVYLILLLIPVHLNCFVKRLIEPCGTFLVFSLLVSKK